MNDETRRDLAWQLRQMAEDCHSDFNSKRFDLYYRELAPDSVADCFSLMGMEEGLRLAADVVEGNERYGW